MTTKRTMYLNKKRKNKEGKPKKSPYLPTDFITLRPDVEPLQLRVRHESGNYNKKRFKRAEIFKASDVPVNFHHKFVLVHYALKGYIPKTKDKKEVPLCFREVHRKRLEKAFKKEAPAPIVAGIELKKDGE